MRKMVPLGGVRGGNRKKEEPGRAEVAPAASLDSTTLTLNEAKLTKPQKSVAPQSGECCTNCHELDNA